ncbi:MAG: DegV family protein [Chloroflexi bacterium]|nr:DegV family protein [Chloroflexota bacterium]
MIKISTDSINDLSPEILSTFDIALAPLHILVDDKDFRDNVDITPADIFRYVDEERKFSKTAAVNAYEYVNLFEELSPKNDAVIHISLSSECSSCYQNAVLAARSFQNVHVVDSRNFSSGIGMAVYDAALMARDGLEPEEICRRLVEDVIPRVDFSFVIDRLDYLYKGGRCSGIEAIGAKMLNIKPCIEITGGRLSVGKKYRGNFDRCLEKYVEDRLSDRQNIDYSKIFVTHPMCTGQTVERVKETIRRCGDFDEIIETRAGCTTSSHSGPFTLGVIFKRKNTK